MTERVTLTTADGVALVGDHYPGTAGGPAILLLHMMPATRASWAPFAGELQRAGFGVLAIDLRGHGESQGGPSGYTAFSDSEHQASIEDARAGAAYLRTRGYRSPAAAGASIGANLSLQLLAEDPAVPAAILLSPGLNYRGIETLPLARLVRPEQAVALVAARDDVASYGSCGDMAEELSAALSTAKTALTVFERGGHGTNLFGAHPDLKDTLTAWLTRSVARP